MWKYALSKCPIVDGYPVLTRDAHNSGCVALVGYPRMTLLLWGTGQRPAGLFDMKEDRVTIPLKLRDMWRWREVSEITPGGFAAVHSQQLLGRRYGYAEKAIPRPGRLDPVD